MMICTKDALYVFDRDVLRKAERDDPELIDMRLFMDAGRISPDEYVVELKFGTSAKHD